MSDPVPKGFIPEPTIRAAISNGFQVFIDDAIPLLVIGFGVFVVSVASRSLVVLGEYGQVAMVCTYILVARPLEFGISFVCLRAVRSGRVNFEHLLALLPNYGSVVLAATLRSMILIGATGLLLIPGIAFYCLTSFLPYLLLEDELGGADAILESMKLSRAHFWSVLGINAIGLTISVLVSFSILGLIPALLLWELSIASFYHAVVRPPTAWQIEDEEELEESRLAAAREELEAAED